VFQFVVTRVLVRCSGSHVVCQELVRVLGLVQEDYHVHGDALGFLHLSHLPTICRKLRVEPSQQAEGSPGSEGSDGSHTLALSRDGMSAASQTSSLAPG